MNRLKRIKRLDVWAVNGSAKVLTLLSLALASPSVFAQSADELAKKLANPVSNLVSVPFQFNFDFGGGIDDDGFRSTLNIQPVIPFSLNDDWNLISRSIMPLVYQDDFVDDDGLSQYGTGDLVQSFFFSPKEPTSNGLIWGVGPVIMAPTASNDSLGSEKWAAGPTGVVLYQHGPWTYGTLANHLESFAGEDNRADVSATFVQPFINYGAGGGLTYALNLEATYNWETEQESVPMNMMVTKVMQLGNQTVSIGGGAKAYLAGPDNGPDWGLRFVFTMLFPK
ncbi:hypothetical protein CLV83_4394 [Marinobacterium mangrovicola]|uniref:Outer membrane beta-barrel porin/alpha-amylase n=1 Tax=Marinobacterium mangrovicola TaxID=1476959 RepID=A0A4R1G3W3_9GAMM|nr:hypothetical protein CLV83_4394 [Marinobacterium mangrovicola]